MSCNPATLLSNGKDFNRLSERDQQIAIAQLLCDVSTGSSGGDIVVFNDGTIISRNGIISSAGTTTAGIQEAIDALPSVVGSGPTSFGGGTVRLGPGIFSTTAPITIPNAGTFGLTLQGSGYGVTVVQYGGVSTSPLLHTVGDPAPAILNYNWLQFRDITFLRPNATQYILNIQRCSYLRVTGCKFAALEALSGAGGSTLNMEADVLTVAPGLVAINIDRSSGGPVEAHIDHNVFDALACGVYFGAPRGSVDHNFFINVGYKCTNVPGNSGIYSTSTTTVTSWGGVTGSEKYSTGACVVLNSDGEFAMHDNRILSCTAVAFVMAGGTAGWPTFYNNWTQTCAIRLIIDPTITDKLISVLHNDSTPAGSDVYSAFVVGQGSLPSASSAAAILTVLDMSPSDGGTPGFNQNFTFGAGLKIGSGTLMKKVLSATAVLDFPSTNAQLSADLTITVTGAALGDAVFLGVPNGSVLANCNFTAWVSATDTVTVRLNNYSSSAKDSASGTFRATVVQF